MHFKDILSPIVLVSALTPAFAKISKTPPALPVNGTFPRHYGLLVWPGFSNGDAFGPVTILDGLAYNYPQLGIHFSIISATMDPVTTRLFNNENTDKNTPFSDFEFKVQPTDTIDAVLARNGTTWAEPYPPAKGQENGENVKKALSPIDVLIVPGGGTGGNTRSVEAKFIKELYPQFQAVVSTCTGSTMFALAGILDGRRATTNKYMVNWIAKQYPKVQWVDRARWVRDGNIWTGSGLAAGVDVMYAWSDSVFGKDVTDFLLARVEQPRWDSADNDPYADIWE